MTAAEAQAPILLGPVACIGCAARNESDARPIWQEAYANRRDIGMLLLQDGRQSAVLFDRTLAVDACTEDFQLSRLRTSAWTVSVPLLYYFSDLSIGGQVSRVKVARGVCLP